MLSVAAAAHRCGVAVDSVKSRAERADVNVVSDGFGGYQVSEPAAGVPFLPRLPEPPPRQVAEAPAVATGPAMPVAGDVMGQAAMQAGGVATMERGPAGAGELPPAPSGPTRPPRRTVSEALHDFVVALPVILLAVLVGGGSVVAVDRALGPATLGETSVAAGDNGAVENGGDDGIRELPRYSAPAPVYGTATFHFMEQGGSDGRVTFNADASQAWFEFFPFSAVRPGTSFLANSAATFTRNASTGWTLIDANGVSQFERAIAPLRLLTFAGYVPDAIREYVTVQAHRTTTLSGRQLDEYTLTYDFVGMQAVDPILAILLKAKLAPLEGGELAQVVLSVDEQGLVWKAVTSDGLGRSLTWTLEYLGPEAFVVQFPTTYYNAMTGEQVNG